MIDFTLFKGNKCLEANIDIILILQMIKLRFRKVE